MSEKSAGRIASTLVSPQQQFNSFQNLPNLIRGDEDQSEMIAPDEQPSLGLTSSAEDSRARTLVLRVEESDWLGSVRDYGTSSIVSLVRSLPAGFSSRTSLACYPATEDEILPSSFQGWQSSGMGGPTGFWTANFSEFHRDASVCSLSDVLETGEVPQKYYLSQKACAGILRRAEKRGRELPQALHEALSQVARAGMPGDEENTM